MDAEVDIRELAAMVAAKRGKRSLRSVVDEIGDVSISTLSRVEQGNVPDLNTFMLLCRWLGVSADRFRTVAFSGAASENQAERITAHLRADRTLAPETAEALATMIKLAYEAASRGELKGKS